MEARTVITVDAILQLKWLDPVMFSSQMNDIYSKDIISQDNVVLGDVYSCFSLI